MPRDSFTVHICSGLDLPDLFGCIFATYLAAILFTIKCFLFVQRIRQYSRSTSGFTRLVADFLASFYQDRPSTYWSTFLAFFHKQVQFFFFRFSKRLNPRARNECFNPTIKMPIEESRKTIAIYSACVLIIYKMFL
jgi:hypothetical protein